MRWIEMVSTVRWAWPSRSSKAGLIADQAALKSVLGPGHESPGNVEALDCREAKEKLREWTENLERSNRKSFEIRRELAAAADLDTLTKRCPSFQAFRKELRAMLFPS